MTEFDIATNPFNILGVSVRSTREEISEAYEDALFDSAHDEHALLQANQALIGPKTRLEAELGWLPELSPSQAREFITLIEEASPNALLSIAEWGLPGLSGANAFASLATRIPGEKQPIEGLISAYEGVSSESARKAVDENRSVSGFSKADPDLVASILPKLTEVHARTAAHSVSQAPHPGYLMTEIVGEFLRAEGGNRAFLNNVVQHYDTWSAPKLREIKDKIDAEVLVLREDAEQNEAVIKIVQLLAEWDEYSQPCQLIEQAKGLNEQRSKELYDELRDICLWLSNEQGEFASTLTISKALLETFPELPSVVIQSSDDIEVLEGLIDEAKSFEPFASLVATVELCRSDLVSLDSDLMRTGFLPGKAGLASTLYEDFLDAALAAKDTEHADVPWMVLRGVAVDLNNTEGSAEGALSILEVLIDLTTIRPSPEVENRLNDELATIRSNIKFDELSVAVKGSDLGAGLRLANEILSLTEDEDQRRLANEIKSGIEQRFRARKRRWLFWGGCGSRGRIYLAE